MQSVGTATITPGVHIQAAPGVGRGPSFGATPVHPDVIDVQLPAPGATAAEQPRIAPQPAVDPLVASFQAMQRWAQSGICTEVMDTSVHFQDRQPSLFAPGSLPPGM